MHTPDVESRLAATVGDRTIAGQEATCREICEWFGDRAFVIRRSTGADGSSSVGVRGHSKRDGTFTCYRYFGRGGSRHSVGVYGVACSGHGGQAGFASKQEPVHLSPE